MAVPFVHRLSTGERRVTSIIRDRDTESLAQDFLDAGGRYLIEILDNGMVHLMAIIDTQKGEAEKVAEETVPNGIELPKAVDRLILAANAYLPPYEMVQRTRILGPSGAPVST